MHITQRGWVCAYMCMYTHYFLSNRLVRTCLLLLTPCLSIVCVDRCVIGLGCMVRVPLCLWTPHVSAVRTTSALLSCQKQKHCRQSDCVTHTHTHLSGCCDPTASRLQTCQPEFSITNRKIKYLNPLLYLHLHMFTPETSTPDMWLLFHPFSGLLG